MVSIETWRRWRQNGLDISTEQWVYFMMELSFLQYQRDTDRAAGRPQRGRRSPWSKFDGCTESQFRCWIRESAEFEDNHL